MKRLFSYISFLFFCIFIYGCGGGISGNTAGPWVFGDGRNAEVTSVYFPLRVGNTWNYNHSPTTSYATWTLSITGTSTINNTTAYTASNFISISEEVFLNYVSTSNQGIKMLADSSGTYESACLFMPFSIPVGTSYTDTCNNNACTVSSKESVSVSAGTFSNCLRIDCTGTSRTYSSWYCPNVGPVKKIISGTGISTLTDTLSSYTVN